MAAACDQSQAQLREQRLGGRQLVFGAVAHMRRGPAPRSRTRSGLESRPVITTGVMPARCSSFRPWPSRMLKRLSVSPCSLK